MYMLRILIQQTTARQIQFNYTLCVFHLYNKTSPNINKSRFLIKLGLQFLQIYQPRDIPDTFTS